MEDMDLELVPQLELIEPAMRETNPLFCWNDESIVERESDFIDDIAIQVTRVFVHHKIDSRSKALVKVKVLHWVRSDLVVDSIRQVCPECYFDHEPAADE